MNKINEFKNDQLEDNQSQDNQPEERNKGLINNQKQALKAPSPRKQLKSDQNLQFKLEQKSKNWNWLFASDKLEKLEDKKKFPSFSLSSKKVGKAEKKTQDDSILFKNDSRPQQGGQILEQQQSQNQLSNPNNEPKFDPNDDPQYELQEKQIQDLLLKNNPLNNQQEHLQIQQFNSNEEPNYKLMNQHISELLFENSPSNNQQQPEEDQEQLQGSQQLDKPLRINKKRISKQPIQKSQTLQPQQLQLRVQQLAQHQLEQQQLEELQLEQQQPLKQKQTRIIHDNVLKSEIVLFISEHPNVYVTSLANYLGMKVNLLTGWCNRKNCKLKKFQMSKLTSYQSIRNLKIILKSWLLPEKVSDEDNEKYGVLIDFVRKRSKARKGKKKK